MQRVRNLFRKVELPGVDRDVSDATNMEVDVTPLGLKTDNSISRHFLPARCKRRADGAAEPGILRNGLFIRRRNEYNDLFRWRF